MKANRSKKKAVTNKTSRTSSGARPADPCLSSNSGNVSVSKTVTYKPGSLLARIGGMVPTVKLGKNAAQNIS